MQFLCVLIRFLYGRESPPTHTRAPHSQSLPAPLTLTPRHNIISPLRLAACHDRSKLIATKKLRDETDSLPSHLRPTVAASSKNARNATSPLGATAPTRGQQAGARFADSPQPSRAPSQACSSAKRKKPVEERLLECGKRKKVFLSVHSLLALSLLPARLSHAAARPGASSSRVSWTRCSSLSLSYL